MQRSSNMDIAVRQAEKIWGNLCSYVELLPITLRYLCKIIIEILRRKCGSRLTAEKEQLIISEIIINRLILKALGQPLEYNVMMDCVVNEGYQELANYSKKILNALGTGIIFAKHVPIGEFANDFLNNSKDQVRKFVKELLDFELPKYEEDYHRRPDEDRKSVV